MKKVSIIIPTFNVEKYIREALQSMVEQTYKNIEILVIDDNSNDNTKSIVSEFVNYDNRVRFINGPCNGIAEALNLGIAIADGDYIARMDADDISLPTRIERQVEVLEKHPEIGVCGTLSMAFNEFGNEHLWGNEKNRLENPGIINQLEEVVVCHPTVMFRKADFEYYGLRYNKDFKTAEDQELWSRAIRVLKFYNIQEVLHRYREHDGNASALKKEDGNKNLIKIKLDLLKWLCPNANFTSDNVEISVQRIVKKFDMSCDDIDKSIFEEYKNKVYRFDDEPKWKMILGLLLFNKGLFIEKLRTFRFR